jgi:hypothetical protein
MTPRYKAAPLEMLPETLSRLITEGAASIGCPAEYLIGPVLGSVAWALGGGINAHLKGDDWIEPAIFWFGTVGPSGSAKTPAMTLGFRSLDLLQDQWHQENSPRRAFVNDATIEALAQILEEHPHGVIQRSDELDSWFGGHTRYKSGGGSDASRWLSFHNAQGIWVDRKTGDKKRFYIRRPIVNIVGGIQPDILAATSTHQNRASGLMSRFLLVMPPDQARLWSNASVSPAALNAFTALLATLSAQLIGLEAPAVARLDSHAQQAWIGFHNNHERQRSELTCGYLKSVWSKSEAYAARFALLIGAVRRIEEGKDAFGQWEMNTDDVRNGIALARWFAAEHARIDSEFQGKTSEAELDDHENWIRHFGGNITVRELMNHRGFSTAGEAERVLQALVRAGRGRFEMRLPGPKGGRPTQVFHCETASENGGAVA